MRRYVWGKRQGKVLSFMVIVFTMLVIHEDRGMAFEPVRLSPTIDYGGTVPLTPGSSTSLDVQTTGSLKFDFLYLFNVNVVVVLCLGEGTLTVELTKDDTQKEVVGMLVMGYPADPMVVPNIGLTPATIRASTVIENAAGGFGMVFIVSWVYSDATPPHAYALTLKLAAPN